MRTVAALCRNLAADLRSDGELLTAFTSGGAEAAFTELVRRHGPLVWGTCRRLLHDPADAEDAFQASFLVLVRRARQLTRYSCVGPWIHRVAVWTARNIRRKNARRLARQTALPDHDHVPDPSRAPDADLKTDLDAALLALPARYRDPIVLCHLLGFTRREAAERLGCPEGTLSGWLNRGLAKLRDRLRGLDPAKVLSGATVAVPAALGASTARAAIASSVAAASIPPTVSLLVEGVLHMFWVKKATAASVALCAVFALGIGIGLGTRTEYSGALAQEKGAEKAPTGEKSKQSQEQREALIAGLEAQIRAATTAQDAALEGAQVAKAHLEHLEKQKATPKEILDAQLTLARFQENAAQATAMRKEAEAKLAALKVVTADKREEIEALEILKQRRESALRTVREAIRATEEQIEATKKQQGVEQKVLEERALAQAKSLEKLLRDAARKEEEIAALKTELAKLKTDAKPEPAKPVGSALNELFGNPAELEVVVKQSEEGVRRAAVLLERHALLLLAAEKQGTPAQIEAAKAELEKARLDSEVARKSRELARARLAAARALHVPPLKALGACIEVVVVDGPAPGACRVREYGRGGALVGSVLTEDAKALELVLARAMKDPAGPRDFWLVVSADHSSDAIIRAAKAGKAAGFTQVRLKGSVPNSFEPLKALSEREFDGTSFDLKKFAP